MPRIRDFVVQDRRRPSWDWAADGDATELAALRAERDELLERVDELHVAAQHAHEREEALSALVLELSTGSVFRRMAAARRMHRHAEAEPQS